MRNYFNNHGMDCHFTLTHGFQRVNPRYFGHPLVFPVAALAGGHLWFSVKDVENPVLILHHYQVKICIFQLLVSFTTVCLVATSKLACQHATKGITICLTSTC